MNSVRYKVKECNMHFGYDEVFNFPEYFLDHTLIVGRRHLISTLTTNLLSELILNYTQNDIHISVWDGSKLYFDNNKASNLMQVDNIMLTGDLESDYLSCFLRDVQEVMKCRENTYASAGYSNIYQYERKYYESIPYYIVMINNWEDAIQSNDICEESFYEIMRKLMDRAADCKMYIIVTSSGDKALPNWLQHKFQYTVHGSYCDEVLSFHDTRLTEGILGENFVAVRFQSSHYDIVRVPDLYESMQEIIAGSKCPFGVSWPKDRLNELQKLYNIKGVSNND